MQYNKFASMLTVAEPMVLIGLLLGGAVPWLFSSMLIRAVGRAAFYIIKECRIQFRDKEIWAGTKKPNYGRVVDICTSAAQAELIGPALLAVHQSDPGRRAARAPTPWADSSPGMIVSGVMLGVFMANAGGAWDNAKKMIEDEPKDAARNLGKGSEKHKAAVTGDTVGDPLEGHRRPGDQPVGEGDEHGRHALADQRRVEVQHVRASRAHAQRRDPERLIGAVIAVVGILLIIWAVVEVEERDRRDEGSRRRFGRHARVADWACVAPSRRDD